MADDVAIIFRKEAKEKGLKRYFTGKPCKHGHVAERQTNNGTCLVCRPIILSKSNGRHPGRQTRFSNKYRKKYPERAKKHSQDTYQRHRSKRLSHNKKYRQANRQKINAKKREYVAKNPALIRSLKQNNRAKRALAKGTHSKLDIKRIFIDQSGKCACCRSSLKAHRYHIDHIIPLAIGGSNWPSNIQLLCKTCNLKKGAKDPINFMSEMGRLL